MQLLGINSEKTKKVKHKNKVHLYRNQLINLQGKSIDWFLWMDFLLCLLSIKTMSRCLLCEMLCKEAVVQKCSVKCVLRNFTKFTGFFLLKKRLWHRCFPVYFVKFPRTPFFYRTPPAAASVCKIRESIFNKVSSKLEKTLYGL